MSKEITYLDYLIIGVNRADDINECIEVLTSARETLETQNEKEPIANIKKDDTIPKDLVSQLKSEMGQKPIRNTEDMAEALGKAIKERLSGEKGKDIDHAVIDDDGYTIYESTKSKETGAVGEER